MAKRGKISRIKISDAEQPGVSRRHLGRIAGAPKPRLTAIQPAQEARVVRVEDEDAHGWLDRPPKTIVLVDPRLISAAGNVAPPGLMVEIPLHGLLQSGFETDAAAAAEVGRKLAGVDRVAVMGAWAVRHIGKERAAGAGAGRGTGGKARGEARVGGEGGIDRVADQANDVAVVALVAA